uniref:CCHC-type domain-containing protein n=1 Tax=Tanacetum cinerariifolium TaxID=118510 RepID=A0A6L2L935_TANCI|nr:hypothetical protein [Tanacetum cinerariifolium]
MDSQSAPVVSAAKLPILNPNEFDLWKIRIEQYFLMTYYSLWEVIINGDSVISRVAVDGVAQPVTVLTAEQKLARKNELKARGTLLMALPNKHQLKFNSHKDAKTLMEAIEKRFGGNTETKKVQKTILKQHQSTNPQLDNEDLKQIDTRRNLGDNRVTTMGFDMSKVECYNCHRKGHFARECRSPKDTKRTGGAEPHRRTTPVETSTSNALVSQCDGIGSYDWSYQVEEDPTNFALMAILSSSSSSDNETTLESVESRLVMYKQNESIFQENIIVLKNEVEARDNFILTLKQKLQQAKTKRDDLKLKFEKFQSSSKCLTELIASQTNNKHDLGYLSSEDDYESVSPTYPSDRLSPSGGYHVVPLPITGNFMPPKPDLVFNTVPLAVESDHLAFNVQVSPAKPAQAMSHTTVSMAHIIEDWVSNSEDEYEPNNLQSVFVQLIEVPILAATPKLTIQTSSSGKRKNRKTYFMCRSVDNLIKDYNFHVKPQTKPTPRNSTHMGCNKQYASFTKKYPQKPKVPTAVLPKSKPVSVTVVRQLSVVVPKIMKSRPRPAHPLNRMSNPSIRRYKTHNQFSKTSNSSLKVTAAKVSVVSAINGKKGKWGNPQYTLKDKGVIDSGCSRHIIGNMSYLSDFQELNGGYVAFGGNPKGGKISDFKLPDESHVLLRVPRENNMYNVNLKDIVPSGDLTCLFAKATIDESNLKVDEGFLVGYSVNSKTFRVFNSRTRIIQETLHVNFLEDKPNFAGTGPTWLFDIDSLTKTMNYQPVSAENQTNPNAGFQDTFDADKAGKEANLQYMLFPVWSTGSLNPQNKDGDTAFAEKEHDAEKPEFAVNLSPSRSALSREKYDMTKKKDKGKSHVECFSEYRDLNAVFEDFSEDNSNDISAASPIVPTAGQHDSNSTNPISAAGHIVNAVGHNYSNSTNPISAAGPLNFNSSPTHGQSSLRDTYQPPDMVEMEDIDYSDHENVGAEADFNNLENSITVSPIPTTRIHNAHPLSQIIGNMSSTTQTRSMAKITRDQGRISQILNEDFHTCMFACFLSQEEPKRVHQALKDRSWIEAMHEELLQFKMQKDERGIVVRNKAILLAQGHTQEEGIDYEEVFTSVARIEAIRLFLAYASFIGFMVYQMDIKSAFLYGTIEEEVYVCQPPGFEDSDHPDKVYKVVKAVYGLHQAPRAWYETLATYLLENGFHRGQLDQTLFIKKQKGDILLVQIYVDDIIFGKSASTPIDTEKPLLKDPDGEDVDVHMYRSMIGSLMYLTSSRPNIMFAQTVVATLSTEAEYVAGASCCAQVLWIQNQMLDYGKFDASEGFYQIIDFINGSYITYDLTVNPTIYVSCIKQFWRTVAVKSSNDVTRLQALVDKKRVVVIEAAIRDALHLDDAEGVDCLPNEEIFIELSHMGYEKPTTKLTFYKDFFSSQWKFLIHIILQSMSAKRTSWNEFSSAMASDVICLSTVTIRVMKKKGNADTTAKESETTVLEDAANDQPIPSPTPLTLPPQQPQDVPSTSRAQSPPLQPLSNSSSNTGCSFPYEFASRSTRCLRLRKVGTSQRVDTSDDTLMEDVSNQGREIDKDEDAVKETEEIKEYTSDTQVEGRQADIYHIDMDHAAKVLSMQEDESEVQEAVEVVTTAKLIIEVVAVVNEIVSAAAVIPSVVPETISAAAIPTVTTPSIKVAAPVKAAVPSTRRKKGVVIRDLEEELSVKTPTETASKDKGKCILVEEPKPIKKKQQVELDEAYARKLQEEFNQDIDWEAAINHVKQRAKEEPFIQRYQIEEEESRAIASINETPAQKAAKRRKLIKEAKEAESIKQHLQIVPDEDDDVFIEATPLARKFPIVDYQMMFKKPDRQDNVWRNQSTVHGQALVKSWKLLTSCGVHIISFNTTQITLLVERRFPLTKFTLEQMLNAIRLQVEEESEMSLKLIRFTRQQLQEAQHN